MGARSSATTLGQQTCRRRCPNCVGDLLAEMGCPAPGAEPSAPPAAALGCFGSIWSAAGRLAACADAVRAATVASNCLSGLVTAMRAGFGSSPERTGVTPSVVSTEATPSERTCGGCGRLSEEFAQGAGGQPFCRTCLRGEDERLLAPLSPEERRGLDFLADLLDTVSWKYWKPGEQPAQILNWLYLGDLQEAMDFDLLGRRGIGAVVNLINWWELSARLPETDLASLYAMRGVEFLEADSEDRLFFDIVAKSWPEVEEFLTKCRDQGQSVLVNCRAGHNRSACVCICWLLIHEGLTLLTAVEWVQRQRGTILSNHGFRLQLVRLALRFERLGEPALPLWGPPPVVGISSPERGVAQDKAPELGSIITKKRLSVRYDYNSKDYCQSNGSAVVPRVRHGTRMIRGLSLISENVEEHLSQRKLKMELLACLYHRGRNFSSDYEYTTDPPTVIGSGFSGDVLLCQRRERTRHSNETLLRCVKKFDLLRMLPDRLEKLKNEAVIYLSLEHPHIARLFDIYEDSKQVSLVMQYCSGGTLEDRLRGAGMFNEPDFHQTSVQMLMAVIYVHRVGIVHRDIKPRNWVYEADGSTLKLIDFGFSVKAYLNETADASGGLQGCLGTLGYLAPEVIRAGLSAEAAYTEKCDIWSLGAVFFELLAGVPAFHRDKGMCDGYTEEVVLREIEDITPEGINLLLRDVPSGAASFLRKLLSKDPAARPSARESLEDPCLLSARMDLLQPPGALPVGEVLERFRAHGRASKTTRAWLLAVARSPTHLPWKDFLALRNTFKMFDARALSGTVNRDSFLAVVETARQGWTELEVEEHDAEAIWSSLCGEQDSLSYCEFLAALLPVIEDAFEDVGTTESPGHDPQGSLLELSPAWREVPKCVNQQWNPSEPVSSFFPLLRGRKRIGKVPTFSEDVKVCDVVKSMSDNHLRWVMVRYISGRTAFFDYMDVSHQLLRMSASSNENVAGDCQASDATARVSSMAVGVLANCSGHSAYVPMAPSAPLRDILRLITTIEDSVTAPPVRRVPIVDANGEVLHVFSCLDFLDLALRFVGPTAVLKSRACRTFDRRDKMLGVSVLVDDMVLNALRIMDTEHLTICPATSRELSGDLGGVVAINVVSVADLKWVMSLGHFSVLDKSVSEFMAWRTSVAPQNLGHMLRSSRLSRFNVISVDAGGSLHMLAQRLLASRLQRIFLSSEDIARIVGIVSSRDILVEVIDQLL